MDHQAILALTGGLPPDAFTLPKEIDISCLNEAKYPFDEHHGAQLDGLGAQFEHDAAFDACGM